MTITLKGRNGSAVVAAFFLCAFTIGSLVGGAITKAAFAPPEGEIIEAGYGSIHTKYGSISHSSYYTREDAEKFNRRLNTNSYVNKTEPEYELIEVFYRRINNETSYTGRGISPDQNLDK